MFSMHHTITTLGISLLLLPLSGNGNPAPQQSDAHLNLCLVRSVPLDILNDSGDGVTSRINTATLSYTQSWSKQQTISVGLAQVSKALDYKDGKQYAFQIRSPGTLRFQANSVWSGERLQLGLDSEFNEDRSEHQYFGDVSYTFPHLAMTCGIAGEQQAMDARYFVPDTLYDLRVTRTRNLFQHGYKLHFGAWEAGVQQAFSLGGDPEPQAITPFSSSLVPGTAKLRFTLSHSNNTLGRIHLYTQFASDTCNADISELDRIIGKIYALDLDHNSYGARWHGSTLDIDLSYHELTGAISAYLQTAPFGSLISRLSGARYYVQGDGKLQYLDLASNWRPQVKQGLDLDLALHFFLGQGHLQNRDYIWQLFNPLMDLAIRELKLNSYMLCQLAVGGRWQVHPDWLIHWNWQRIIPLHLDYEYTASGAPGRPSDSYENHLSTVLSLSLSYGLK